MAARMFSTALVVLALHWVGAISADVVPPLNRK